MIDHITLPVSDYRQSKEFYQKALQPLGYSLLQEVKVKKLAGFGTEDIIGKRDFWIREDKEAVRGSRYCIALKAENKKAVDKFYNAAIKASGKDNGTLGFRNEYYSGYYAAFVFDPDGYNIEAVFDVKSDVT